MSIEFLLASSDGRSGLAVGIPGRTAPYAVELGGGSTEAGTVVVSLDGRPAFTLDPAKGTCHVEVQSASEVSASGAVECHGLTGDTGTVDLARTEFRT